MTVQIVPVGSVELQPLQPLNVELLVGAAVSMIVLPIVN
jgi:hypothetical protein